MQKTASESPPQTFARVGGILYLVIFIAGFYSIWVWSRLIGHGDSVSTIARVAASGSAARLATLSEIIMLACDVPLAVILYALLRPVNRTLSLLAAFLRLLNPALGGVATLGHVALVSLASGASATGPFDPRQLHDVVWLSLQVHRYANDVALIFFGLHCLILGYLIFKSRYLPKTIGVLLAIASGCYLVNSVSDLLFPGIPAGISAGLFAVSAVAELSLCSWLLFARIDPAKWQQAVLAAPSVSG